MSSTYGTTIGRTPDWTDDERPVIAGSAAKLQHSGPRRIAYGIVSVLCGITAGLGNAMISANLPQIQGHMGLTPAQGALLPAVYMMTYMSANLMLFKFRQQFGLRRYVQIAMPLYATLTLLHLTVDSYGSALIVRAVSGLATAALTSLGVLYMMQAFGPKLRINGLIVGVGLSQMATPLAWLLSPALLDLGAWHTLYMFESGLALCCLAATSLLHLPAGQRARVYQWQDIITVLLLVPALGLLSVVLSQGTLQWWTNAQWIAWALIGSLVLGTAGIIFERHRAHPLLNMGWIGTADTIRLVIGAMALRFLTSEQSVGAVGLLRQLGMGPDQLQSLYMHMLIGLIAGTALSALTFGRKTLIPQILGSVVLIAAAGFLDHNSTSLTRPHDMFLSQTLVSLGSGLFIGPLLVTTIVSAVKVNPQFVISGVVLFAISQTMGGLAGSAALGSFQFEREHQYSSAINAGVDPTDPVVAGRIRLQSGIYAKVLTDPVLRQAEGLGALAKSASLQATVRAYNDVFLLIGALAIIDLVWSLLHVLRRRRRSRNATAS